MVCVLLSTVVKSGQGHSGWAPRHREIASGKAHGLGPASCRFFLWTASLIYGLGVRLRNFFYHCGLKKSVSVELPVVCVGNLTTGGTGKTPCVEWVARQLRSRGLRVALISRGYGGTGGVNDEALVLENHLDDVPHLQGSNRAALCKTALEELESEAIVLDDGFQHRQLARDLDLVLIDASNPWGYGHLLPRGLLREPVSGLRRAHAVIITRADHLNSNDLASLKSRIQKLAPKALIAEAVHQPVELIRFNQPALALKELEGKSVLAFCGLGNPEAFFKSLQHLGANVAHTLEFPDHHPYTREDMDAISHKARESNSPIDWIVTTEKDLVKIRSEALEGCPLLALGISFELRSGKESLENLLARICQR